MSREDGEHGAGFLYPPSFTTEEKGSHACTSVGCETRFDIAADLCKHRDTAPGEFENFGEILERSQKTRMVNMKLSPFVKWG